MNTETLVPDELRGELIKEAQISLLQLHTTEVASQLTLDDFKVFKSIEPTEYIDNLFGLKSKYGTPNLQKFTEVSVAIIARMSRNFTKSNGEVNNSLEFQPAQLFFFLTSLSIRRCTGSLRRCVEKSTLSKE